jgi:asparagine synthase (glutamine-hydrolysing)
MCARIVHRGPDDQGTLIDGPVGLGMRRLSVIDLDTGRQPVFNEDRTVATVFNGEIYNFQELRAQLVARGHRFSTNTDTEVIVHLYEEVGEDLAQHLNGMFAIAIWDRVRQRLVLIRDRLGVKPLYYARTPDGLRFGSEIKCVLADGKVETSLSMEAVYHYAVFGYIPHPLSIYQAIRVLPPGCRLVYDADGLVIDRYWDVPCGPPVEGDYQEACQRLRELLSDAVQRRMISDVPLGAFLSGGLDSSIVVALMAKSSSQPVNTFHIDFTEPEFSERQFARSVARRYGTDHHELVVRPNAIEILDRVVDAFDEPFGDSSALPTWYVSQLTRQYVTVALAGDGGDEAFGGYLRYREILHRRDLPLRASQGAVGLALDRLLPTRAPGKRYLKTMGLSHQEYFAVGSAEAEARELLHPDLVAEFPPGATRQFVRDDFGSAGDTLSPFTRFDTKRYLPDDILVKVDRMSMAHSLEVRAPFLDYRLVEWAAQMPAGWKIQGPDTKRILRDTFREDLPADVLAPRKRGFSLPMAAWLRGELREELRAALHDPDLARSGIWNLPAVARMAEEHWGNYRNRKSQLWRFLFFARWWHRHSPQRNDSLNHSAGSAS